MQATDIILEKLLYKAVVKPEFLADGPIIFFVIHGMGSIVWESASIKHFDNIVQDIQTGEQSRRASTISVQPNNRLMIKCNFK